MGDCVFLPGWQRAPQDLGSETVSHLPNMHLTLKLDANPQCLATTIIDEQKQNLLLQNMKSEYNSIFQYSWIKAVCVFKIELQKWLPTVVKYKKWYVRSEKEISAWHMGSYSLSTIIMMRKIEAVWLLTTQVMKTEEYPLSNQACLGGLVLTREQAFKIPVSYSPWERHGRSHQNANCRDTVQHA